MPAYYNEFDPKTAAWLRELIKEGLIADGIVDERSITEVHPDDLSGFTQVHMFAGIGGWSYALRLAGWPDDCPVWTGSCPCQPFSTSGKGLGKSDPRHLWPEFFRLIKKCCPAIIFGEQVAGPDALDWLDGVFLDLEEEDYACGAADLCACGVGAPHKRQRLMWGANANSHGMEGFRLHTRPVEVHRSWGSFSKMALLSSDGLATGAYWPQPLVRSVDYGLPRAMGLLHGYGNAIVPQVAAQFIQAYLDCLHEN